MDEMKKFRCGRDAQIAASLVLVLGGCSGERADAINNVGGPSMDPTVGMVPAVGMDPKPAPSSPSPAPSTSTPSASTSGPLPQSLRTCMPSAVTTLTSPQMSSEGDGKRTIGDKGYVVTPEFTVNPALPHGVVKEFTMNSADSKIFPGVKGPYTRRVWVYVPVGYVPGSPAPFIVVQDGYGYADDIPNLLDSLIPGKCLPKMVGIMIDNGGGTGPGSERGFEYDNVSDRYARFLETEVFPRVEQEASVVLTKDGEGGAALGGSSGGTAAFGLGWFRPERFRRIITYSGSYVNWQSPKDPLYPYGAWEYHATLIPKSDPKPLRVWLEVASGDWDATSAPRVQLDMQTANLKMYETLAAKGLHVQYNYAQNAGHNDPIVSGATLVDALIWLWRGYPIE